MNINDYMYLHGAEHTFPDGIRLRIIQLKQREDTCWVTYETDYGNSLPRRFSQKVGEFLDIYGHLFTP
jgi:hypothetical protein